MHVIALLELGAPSLIPVTSAWEMESARQASVALNEYFLDGFVPQVVRCLGDVRRPALDSETLPLGVGPPPERTLPFPPPRIPSPARGSAGHESTLPLRIPWAPSGWSVVAPRGGDQRPAGAQAQQQAQPQAQQQAQPQGHQRGQQFVGPQAVQAGPSARARLAYLLNPPP